MVIRNYEKVLILPGVSGNMSMLYDRLMFINYPWLLSHDHTKTYLSNVNINSALKPNVLNREHAYEHLATTILLTRQLCSIRSGIISIVLFSCG